MNATKNATKNATNRVTVSVGLAAVLGAVAALALSWGRWETSSEPAPLAVPAAKAPSADEDKLRAIHTALTTIQNGLAALRDEHGALAGRTERWREEINAALAERPGDPELTPAPAAEGEAALADSHDPAQEFAELNSRMQEQQIDTALQAELENRLRDAFDPLEGGHLGTVECGETICRMEATLPPALGDEPGGSVEALLHGPGSWEGSTTYRWNTETGELVAYLTQED